MQKQWQWKHCELQKQWQWWTEETMRPRSGLSIVSRKWPRWQQNAHTSLLMLACLVVEQLRGIYFAFAFTLYLCILIKNLRNINHGSRPASKMTRWRSHVGCTGFDDLIFNTLVWVYLTAGTCLSHKSPHLIYEIERKVSIRGHLVL